jgi:hypothetical protein
VVNYSANYIEVQQNITPIYDDHDGIYGTRLPSNGAIWSETGENIIITTIPPNSQQLLLTIAVKSTHFYKVETYAKIVNTPARIEMYANSQHLIHPAVQGAY